MADLVFNIAKGAINEYYRRVDGNDPANSALIVVPVDVGATSDATIRDFATLAAVLAGGVTERTTGGWNRKTLTDADLAAAAVDNTNDWYQVLLPSPQTWTAVTGASLTTTDLIVCYDSDTTGGTDANIIPLTMNDFVITPDGTEVQAVISGTTGFFRAT